MNGTLFLWIYGKLVTILRVGGFSLSFISRDGSPDLPLPGKRLLIFVGCHTGALEGKTGIHFHFCMTVHKVNQKGEGWIMNKVLFLVSGPMCPGDCVESSPQLNLCL